MLAAPVAGLQETLGCCLDHPVHQLCAAAAAAAIIRWIVALFAVVAVAAVLLPK